MRYELTLKTKHSQYIGMIDDKSIVLNPDKKMILTDNEWDQVKNRKWNKHLISEKLLEIKEIEKKMKKMEKEIESGVLEVND